MKLTTEIVFAQRLADNEKSVRDRAMKKLGKYISARSGSENGTVVENAKTFTETDLLRICKGLFYCMWMSDKPLIQEELAKSMTKLVHRFHTYKDGLRFTDAFLKTFVREWHGLDQWRVDKFQTLVREFLKETFHLIRAQNWSVQAVNKFTQIITHRLTRNDDAPHGLLFHVVDIYVEELARAALDKVAGSTLTLLLMPFCQLLVETRNMTILKAAITRIFEYSIRLCDPEDEDEQDETIDPAEFAEEKEDLQAYGKIAWEEVLLQREMKAMEVPHPKFNYAEIAARLSQLTQKSKCRKKSRGKIMSLIKKLESMADGEYPLDIVHVTDESDLDDEDVEAAAERLMKDEEMDRLETGKHRLEMKQARKRNKPKRASKSDEFHEEEDDDDEDEFHEEEDDEDLCEELEELPKKKKQHSVHIMQMYSGNSDNEPGEDDTISTTNDSNKSKSVKRKKATKQVQPKVQANGVKKRKVGGQKPSNEVNSSDQKATTPARKLENHVQIATNIIAEIPKAKKCTSKGNAFAKFLKAPNVPKATVRGLASAKDKKAKLNEAKLEVLKAIRASQVKKVNFALAQNISQGPKEYMQSVRSSPDVPFDAKKMPGHCVLKSSGQEKRKRSSAMDFF